MGNKTRNKKTRENKKTRLRKEAENYCYISLLFDVNRGGVADIAENILLFLDYESFKNFKRTCKMVHQFVINSKIEQIFIENLPKEFKRHQPGMILPIPFVMN